MTNFAYLHSDKDGNIFYVGKGSGMRHLDFSNRGVSHKNHIKEIGYSNVIVGKIDCSSSEIALELEKGLIKCAKRTGFRLLNKASGGTNGPVGCVRTEEEKRNLSIIKTGFKHSDETKKLMSLRRKGKKKTKPVSEKTRALRSAMLKGIAPSIACLEACQKACSKKVICLDNGNVFSSATAASESLNLNKKAVANGILKNRRVAGLTWRYL